MQWSSAKTRSLLVTGGAGFIGSNFTAFWVKRHPDDNVNVLDELTYAGNLANLDAVITNENLRFVRGNILDQKLVEEIIRSERIDTIVHFAAESHVDRSISSPDQFIDTNVKGTHSLLKAARNLWSERSAISRRFHHVSTDEVFGSLSADDPPSKESTPYAPNSPYAASKAASDHLVRAYHHTYGLSVTMSYCSNNYGPYQFPEKLIPLVIVHALQGKAIPVYGDGLNIRDWAYVEDHCRGIELILEKGVSGSTYNIGGNNEWTNIDLVSLICRLIDEDFGKNPELGARYPDCPAARGNSTRDLVSFVKDRPGHDRRYALDCSKASSELGFSPVETFESGIQKTIQWYFDNEVWWRQVMAGSHQNWMQQQYALAD